MLPPSSGAVGKEPTNFPSGDQKGKIAPSVPRVSAGSSPGVEPKSNPGPWDCRRRTHCRANPVVSPVDQEISESRNLPQQAEAIGPYRTRRWGFAQVVKRAPSIPVTLRPRSSTANARASMLRVWLVAPRQQQNCCPDPTQLAGDIGCVLHRDQGPSQALATTCSSAAGAIGTETGDWTGSFSDRGCNRDRALPVKRVCYHQFVEHCAETEVPGRASASCFTVRATCTGRCQQRAFGSRGWLGRDERTRHAQVGGWK